MSDSDAPPPSTSPAADTDADADAAAAAPLAAAPLPLAADGNVKAKELKRLQKAYKRRGVVYMSRVPPNMRPQKVRHLLSAHADIGRVYLAPEDAAARAARRKGAKGAAAASARSKRYVEGWIEFEDKRVAKQVAATLNATPIGGKRRSAHAADLWTLKYLPGFKWDDLTADVAAAAHARDARRAAEAAAAAADRDFYLAKVDAARAAERADARRAAKRAAEGVEGDAPPAPARPAKRQYGQRPAAPGADARALPRGALAALAGL